MNPLTQSKDTTILPVLIALVLACFALAPQAQATCQQGCSDFENTFLGEDALLNTTGFGNTAVGFDVLVSNTGDENTALGLDALQSNTTGFGNTAVGALALEFNTTGNANAAFGLNALIVNTTGEGNTAIGENTLVDATDGKFNTALGADAGLHLIHGHSNIAVGFQAGMNLTNGDNNIDIGSDVARAGESKTIRIGTTPTHRRTFIAGISGVTVAGGVGVIVDTNGQLGTVVSSERFKDQIKPMDKASEAILALKPVTFRYKRELDPEGIPQFGLVAEQVEKINPDLVARDENGKPYTVRYEAVNAMLLNEFLKEHRAVQEQEATIALLKSTDQKQEAIITQLKSSDAKQAATIAAQQKQIEALTAGLQKVSTQLELNKPAPQTALNDQ